VNVYDLLRAIAAGQPVDPARARALISKLEGLQLLGPSYICDHECQPKGLWFPESLICDECGGPLEARPHACEAGWDLMTSTGEHGGNIKYALKCVICGREMTPAEVYGAG